MHPIIVLCLALLAVGLVAAVRWGGQPFPAPAAASTAEPPGALGRAKRALWYVDVHLLAAIATGLLVIGPGGRLVMRLLAVTAGDPAQGRVTEADEIVGRVSVDGTLGVLVFVGLFGAFLLAVAAGVLRPWLPVGRLGALCVAGALLLTGATRNDPLRPENPDFDLVGPAWLAIAAFTALVVASALVFEAIATRAARAVPLLDGHRPLTFVVYLPLLLVGLTGLLPVAILVAILAASLGAVPALRRWWAGPLRTGGRVVLVGAAVALLPLLVLDLRAIVDRSAG
jgi:hypothetical protein